MARKRSSKCRCVRRNGRRYCFKHVGKKSIRGCKPAKKRRR